MKAERPIKPQFLDPRILTHVRKHNKFIGKREREDGIDDFNNWTIRHSSLEDYGTTFNSILAPENLDNLLSIIASRPNKSTILDLMASDAAVLQSVRDYGFNFGLAVSLGYRPRKNSGPYREFCSNLNGDLTIKKTWSKIRKVAGSKGFEYFDIIICRPEGGILDSRLTTSTLFFILQESWRLLSYDDGVFLFQIPQCQYFEAEKYFSKLKQKGFSIDWSEPVNGFMTHAVVLSKRKDSPSVLPSPLMLGMK